MSSKFRIVVGTLAILGATFGTVACGEKPAPVSKKADHKVVAKADPTPVPDPSTDIVVEADPVVEEPTPTPADSTADLGDTVQVGDWSVVVTRVVLNADDKIKHANMFNDPAKGQFVLVTYSATYTGDERTGSLWDLTWTMTGSDNKIIDSASEVTPADDEEWPTEARKGGTVQGQEVFDVKADVLKGALLSVEGYDANFDETYADFALVTG